MSVGMWSPQGGEQSAAIDDDALRQFIVLGNDEGLDAERLKSALSAEEQHRWAGLMRIEAAAWLEAAQRLDETQILALIRFFTIAEQALPNWQAGKQSPVIALAKSLRSRGFKMPRELLQWIKAHSDNRFLPYGSL